MLQQRKRLLPLQPASGREVSSREGSKKSFRRLLQNEKRSLPLHPASARKGKQAKLLTQLARVEKEGKESKKKLSFKVCK
jgi:hypothetical protein